jgi:hypothetical protein
MKIENPFYLFTEPFNSVFSLDVQAPRVQAHDNDYGKKKSILSSPTMEPPDVEVQAK